MTRATAELPATIPANTAANDPVAVEVELPGGAVRVSGVWPWADTLDAGIGVRLGTATGRRIYPVRSGGDGFVTPPTAYGRQPLEVPVAGEDDLVAHFVNSTASDVDAAILVGVVLD
jgi:hypothetical protein